MVCSNDQRILKRAVQFAASSNSFRDDSEFFILFDITKSEYQNFAQRVEREEALSADDWPLLTLTIGLVASYPHQDGDGFSDTGLSRTDLVELQSRLRANNSRPLQDVFDLWGFRP